MALAPLSSNFRAICPRVSPLANFPIDSHLFGAFAPEQVSPLGSSLLRKYQSHPLRIMVRERFESFIEFFLCLLTLSLDLNERSFAGLARISRLCTWPH